MTISLAFLAPISSRLRSKAGYLAEWEWLASWTRRRNGLGNQMLGLPGAATREP